jgi:GTP cyclohydrolase I
MCNCRKHFIPTANCTCRCDHNEDGFPSPEESATLLLAQTTGWKDDSHGHETPARFVAMLKEMTTPPDIKWKTFPNEEKVDEIVTVQDIPFVSLCNHHVVPFVGLAHIGYIPGDCLVGLSKFARVVRHYAHALQVQERLTSQIAEFLEDSLKPAGVAVVIEAEHMCMTIRGVQTPGTKTTTSKMTGAFMDHNKTAKDEFLRLIGK